MRGKTEESGRHLEW